MANAGGGSMNNHHLGSTFDSWLEEEGLKIDKNEVMKRFSEKLKEECYDFLQNRMNPKSENAQKLKEQIIDVLNRAKKDKIIEPNYKIKRTKLPRKLKKKYKKEQRICFDVEYRKLICEYEFTIPIDESEANE